jgi:hypothetical protein
VELTFCKLMKNHEQLGDFHHAFDPSATVRLCQPSVLHFRAVFALHDLL